MSTQQDDRGNLPSASGIHRIYACPGSPALEAQAPESEPDSTAQEGQDIHAALEDPEFVELDEKTANIAEHIRAMEEKAASDWKWSISAKEAKNPTIKDREVRLWIRDNGKPIASAKPDSFMVCNNSGFVFDAKTGYLPVTDARRNIQARIQALALNEEFGPLTRIRAVMAAYRFRGSLTVCDYGPDDLKRAKEELRFNLWRSSLPYAPRVPGIDQCRYCKAAKAGICREAGALTLLPATVTQDPKDILTKVHQLSPADLAAIYLTRSLREKIDDAVVTRLRSFSREVLNEVGLDLGTPGSSRTVENIQKLWAILHHHGVTQEEFVATCKAAIGKVEALMVPKLRAANPAMTSDTVAKKYVAKIIEPAVETKPKAAPLIAYKKEITNE